MIERQEWAEPTGAGQEGRSFFRSCVDLKGSVLLGHHGLECITTECHGVQQEDQTLLPSEDASVTFCSRSTESLNSSPQALAWPQQLLKSSPASSQSLKDQILMVEI